MGTPNRFQQTVSGYIKVSDITHQQWLVLLHEALARCCKADLKYLIDFDQFGKFVNSPTATGAMRTTDENTKMCNFPNKVRGMPNLFDFSGDTQCVLLATGPEKRWDCCEKPTCRYTGRFVERKHLLLTRNGRTVEWHWIAEERVNHMELVGDYVTEVGVSSTVALDGSLGLAEFNAEFAKEAFLTLHHLLKKKIKKDEERLARKREVIGPLEEVVDYLVF